MSARGRPHADPRAQRRRHRRCRYKCAVRRRHLLDRSDHAVATRATRGSTEGHTAKRRPALCLSAIGRPISQSIGTHPTRVLICLIAMRRGLGFESRLAGYWRAIKQRACSTELWEPSQDVSRSASVAFIAIPQAERLWVSISRSRGCCERWQALLTCKSRACKPCSHERCCSAVRGAGRQPRGQGLFRAIICIASVQ